MPVSRATFSPGIGDCAPIKPLSAPLLFAAGVSTNVNPKSATSFCASSSLSPTIVGTSRCAGPTETSKSIAVPFSN